VRLSRIVLGLAAIVGIAVVVPSLVFAAADYGGGSVQGYAADTPLDNGTIVQLTGKDSNKVKVATKAEQQNMFGVTVDRNALPLTISNENLENEVFVAVSGTYNVLVSTENGSIAAGDYVLLSSVNGVAMRADTEKTTVFGRAASKFDGTGVTLGTTTLKDTDGKASRTVTLGLIPVTIDIRHNPNDKSTKVKVPEALERLGQAIAEKDVSPIRIYLSMAITLVSLLMALSVLYAGIRNGVISIGRNPMSKKTIFHAIAEVVLTSFLILIIGLFAVYLLLKL
jgi:hypothetical protein